MSVTERPGTALTVVPTLADTDLSHCEADVSHPREHEPCEQHVQHVRVPAGDRYAALCLTHGCEAGDLYETESEAVAMFRCDRGRHWWFIVHHDHNRPTIPALTDLSGLYAEVRAYAARAAAGDHSDVLVVWRYLLDGTCQEVEFECEKTGEDRYKVYVHATAGPVSEYPVDYAIDGATYLHEQIEFC